ncbi:MAG: hypothetical protein EAZ95_06530 [Bacteroidetes bacterium]|nr:MAG: hypothetical protein EAZ95_06530 [Bacteroidota bacterium]
MGKFFFSIIALGGLVWGGMWLKNHYHAFLQEGINQYTVSEKDQKQGRNVDEPEKDAEQDTEQEATNALKFKASPTNLPNAQKIQRGTDSYEFTYVFRDVKGKGVQFQWTSPKKLHSTLTKKFGLPKDFFDRTGKYTPQEIAKLQKDGSFRQAVIEGKQFTIPDYNKIARDNRTVTLPIYKMIKQYLGKNASNMRILETLMTFCQDIPYKRPPASRKGVYIGELDVPAKMLTVGTGDCDTKSVFFVSTALHQPTIKTVVVLVDNPSHMFVGVKGVPTPYQAYITYQGEKYIVCEPVGNARLPIGQLGFKECKTKMVVKINP